MNWRVTAVLFLLVVIVGGYAYYDSQTPDETPVPTVAAAPVERVRLLPDVTIDTVTELGVRRSTAISGTGRLQATYFRDATGSWLQIVPTRTVALSATLDTAVTGILNLDSRRSLDVAAADLEPFGLATPDHEIRLTYLLADGSARRVTFIIGSQTPAGDAYYIQRVGDGRVHLVAPFSIDALLNLLSQPPFPLPTPTPITIDISPPITDTVPITP